MISYQQAKNILKKAKIRIKDEEISTKNSLNRVVARDIISPSNHPLCDNAAFDGYAINSKDLKFQDQLQLEISLLIKKLKNLMQLRL